MTCKLSKGRENARLNDANRAVVSPLPRLVMATEKAKRKDWIYFYPRRSVGPSGLEYLFDLMTFLLILYQFHVSQSIRSSSEDEYLYHR